MSNLFGQQDDSAPVDVALRLNIKQFGYTLGRDLYGKLQSRPVPSAPVKVPLTCKPTTQEDVESDWFLYWCNELQLAPLYHRKLWEFAFALQTLYNHDLLREGVKAIGYGCGQEPLPSYFAKMGIASLVTDLQPEAVAGSGWAETGQHAATLEHSFFENLVTREVFDKHVTHRFVDMNAIPGDLYDTYDFCWSICSLEHVGSIRKGLDFVKNSVKSLKPGGVAVHTTEFNYLSKDKTVDNKSTVLFLRKHFEMLRDELAGEGHEMLEPDFDIGKGVLDRFIDMPPYTGAEDWFQPPVAGYDQEAHLKLALDGYPCTCFGIAVKKKA